MRESCHDAAYHVAQNNAPYISMFTPTGAFIRTFGKRGGGAVAVDTNGRVYVASATSPSQVQVYDSTGATQCSVTGVSSASGVAVDNTASRLYVAQGSLDSQYFNVSVFNTSSCGLVQQFGSPLKATGAALDSTSQKLFVFNLGYLSIRVFATSDGSLLSSFPAPFGSLATDDTDRIYLHTQNTVVISNATGTTLGSFAVPGVTSAGIAVFPSSGSLRRFENVAHCAGVCVLVCRCTRNLGCTPCSIRMLQQRAPFTRTGSTCHLHMLSTAVFMCCRCSANAPAACLTAGPVAPPPNCASQPPGVVANGGWQWCVGAPVNYRCTATCIYGGVVSIRCLQSGWDNVTTGSCNHKFAHIISDL